MTKTKLLGVLCLLFFTLYNHSTNADNLNQRYYLAPMGSYINTDNRRNTDDSLGAHLTFGKSVNLNWDIEISGISNQLKRSIAVDEYRQLGILFDGVHYFNRTDTFAPYAVMGFGVFNTSFKSRNESRPVANIGMGFTSRLTSYGLKLRGDLRLQHDEGNLFSLTYAQDIVANIGLSVPLGKTNTPKIKPAIPLVVQDLDNDQDGVANTNDQCANTPIGTKTNQFGCPADSDGDGVFDLADVCPDTPQDSIIDQHGCIRDSDGDGIADLHDQCGNTPNGIDVNLNGCITDSDNDGIADNQDQCSQTRANSSVNSFGCEFDSDNDGIADSQDQCSQTPTNSSVNSFGCEFDSDNDGIADSRDQCSQTPTNSSVNSFGCEFDSDNDGVVDNRDQCANTPANLRTDNVGCEIDSDNDGIADSSDICPNTKLGAHIDSAGCDIRDIIATHKSVQFELNSHTLTSASKHALEAIAIRVQQDPSVVIHVAGFTDDTGPQKMNAQLSKHRADIVKDYLIGRGVPKANLISHGYGSSLPIANNTTRKGRILNRRVEFFVME